MVGVWRDLKQDGKDELIWEFENCENGTGWIKTRSKEPMGEPVLRQVWGAGDRPMAGGCLLLRLYVCLVGNFGEFGEFIRS